MQISLYASVGYRLPHSSSIMPRVKKCSDASRVTEETLPTIQTMQFMDNVNVDASSEPPFDTDTLLEEMFPDKTNDKTCPICSESLQYDEVTTKRGTPSCYYHCPAVNDFTKCFVASGADDIDLYLDRVKQTLHPMFVSGPNSFEPSLMRCYCNKSLILALSKSDKNKYRLYFKCPKGEYSFFQWGDSQPVGKVMRWLHQGVNPDVKGKEQRHKPYDLAKPIPRQRNFEARPRR